MPAPYVGMGLTWFLGTETYPGTILGISEDGRSIFFQQNKPHRARGTYFGTAFVFTPALPIKQVFEAKLGDDGATTSPGTASP